MLNRSTIAIPILAAFTWIAAAEEPPVDPATFDFKIPVHDNPLSTGRLALGNGNIRAAWFSDPERDYAHHALGGEEEPRTLVVSTDQRVVVRLTLPDMSVFEDRQPRIVDVDGDGLDEIVVIRSYMTRGSTLAIVALTAAGLSIVAETEPSGVPFEWLNPAGVGDFDGDGKRDIAVVRRPHDVGQLEIYTLSGFRLEKILTIDDVSNHALGKPDTRLSLVRDFDGDGADDLAIPTFDRHMLQILSFKDRKIRELNRYYLPARASEDFSFGKRRGVPVLVIGLVAGRKHYIRID